MAKTKPTKKRVIQQADVEYSEKKFEYTHEDSTMLTLNVYFRLLAMKRGQGNNGDRITLKIRLLVGLDLLKAFESSGVHEILQDAYDIIHGSWDMVKKTTRVLTAEENREVGLALTIVDTICECSSLWEEASAYKRAEDQCLPGANKFEYVLIKSE